MFVCWPIIVHNKAGLRTVAAFPGHDPSESLSGKELGFTAVTLWSCQWGFRTKTWDPRVGCRAVAALIPNMARGCGASVWDIGTQKLLGPQKAGPSATTATALSPKSGGFEGTPGSSISLDQHWWRMWESSATQTTNMHGSKAYWSLPAHLLLMEWNSSETIPPGFTTLWSGEWGITGIGSLYFPLWPSSVFELHRGFTALL